MTPTPLELLDAFERATDDVTRTTLLTTLKAEIERLEHDHADLRYALNRAEERAGTAERTLHDNRQWEALSGVFLVEIGEGRRRMSRLIAPIDDIPAALTEASVLRHHDAITTAVRAVQEEMRASFKFDAKGNATSYTLPAASSIADRLVTEIARALQQADAK